MIKNACGKSGINRCVRRGAAGKLLIITKKKKAVKNEGFVGR